MKIGIIGSNGQLGTDCCEIFSKENFNVIYLNHDAFDISQSELVFKVLKEIKPDVIINTAAYHNFGLCEKNSDKAFLINSTGVKILSELSNDLSFKLVHISTDYVFDGTSSTPYKENDSTNPINVYGISKLAGEHFIQSISNNFIIIRTSSLFGKNPCRAKNGLNFVQLMIKLVSENKPIQIVNDQYSSPTYTHNLAIQIKNLVKNNSCGLYHIVNDGGCSWYEFAKEIFRLLNLTPNLSSKNYNKTERRPKYSILKNSKLISMPHWKESLKEYLSL